MSRRIVELTNADGSRSRWVDGREWCGGATCADADHTPCEYHRFKKRARVVGRR